MRGPTMPTFGCSSRVRTSATAPASSSTESGLSHITTRPVVAASPWFTAAAKPRFTGFAISPTRGRRATRSTLASEDALSTTATSYASADSWRSSESRHASRNGADS